MSHQHLQLLASCAEPLARAAELLHLGRGGLGASVSRAQSASHPSVKGEIQHPGRNIAATGHRAITAWRSGRRF